MVEHVPHYQAGVIAGLVALLVLGILLVTAGVGLIYMRPWARTLSLVYAPLSILNRVGNFVYWIVLLAPAMKAFYQQMARSNSGLDPTILIADKFIYLSLILGLVVVVYPVVVLVVLLRPSVAAAFRDQAQDFQPPDDYDLGRAGPDGPPPSDAIPL
jgi:hypothetical protein